MKPLHIAQYIDSYLPAVDGVVTAVRNYAYWLNRNYGHCCVVAPLAPDFVNEDPFDVYNLTSVALPKRAHYRVALPGLDSRVRGRVLENLPDIIHAHTPFGAGMEALNIGKRRHIPVVATFHSKYRDDFKRYTGSDFLAREGARIIARFYTRADSVWAVSEPTAAVLRDYGYSGEIHIMPNGTDMQPPHDARRMAAQVEHICRLPNEQYPLLLFVGQHIWEKNTRLVIEGAAKAREMGKEFRLCFVGDGYARDELIALSKQLGLEDTVLFLGRILDRELLAGLFTRAQALLFPSMYDNAPLVIREAASLGCPSVMMRGSDAAVVIQDDENGFLCDNDPLSMGRVIAGLIDRPEYARQVGLQASETLAQSWDGIVAMVYESYMQVIEQYHMNPGRQKRKQKKLLMSQM